MKGGGGMEYVFVEQEDIPIMEQATDISIRAHEQLKQKIMKSYKFYWIHDNIDCILICNLWYDHSLEEIKVFTTGFCD